MQKTFSFAAKVQRLLPSNFVLTAMWKYQYLPLIRRWHEEHPPKKDCDASCIIDDQTVSVASTRTETLRRRSNPEEIDLCIELRGFVFYRLNAHEGIVQFEYSVATTARKGSNGSNARTNESYEKFLGIRLLDAHFIDGGRRSTNAQNDQSIGETKRMKRLAFMNDLLKRAIDSKIETSNPANGEQRKLNPDALSTYFDPDYWKSQLIRYEDTQRWVRDPRRANPDNYEFKRCCRLLNHLTRRLMLNYKTKTLDETVELLLTKCKYKHTDLLSHVYAEPPNASPFSCYQSTILMHHKQQHGLNTKHAAAVSTTSADATNSLNSSRSEAGSLERRQTINDLRSAQDFDSKLHLDMCSSGDKKEIFELMLSMDVTIHVGLCQCRFCKTVRTLANAWRYYDCGPRAWLRLEFNRKDYQRVVEALSDLREHDAIESKQSETSNDATKGESFRLIYLSYKNEFTDRDSYVANLVNYHSFYENGERPVTFENTTEAQRENIGIIATDGLINWAYIEEAKRNNSAQNSISLNQQSIFKCCDNTLYAIFSENSINRMSKEKKQKVLSVNAPYVNRGFGALPNCSINAFTTRISHPRSHRSNTAADEFEDNNEPTGQEADTRATVTLCQGRSLD